MNTADLLGRIREKAIGAQDKQVFLVEGADDQRAWQILLARFVPDWEQRWGLATVGNKKQLVDCLEKAPDWSGLVDRDEWDDAMVKAQTGETPNLLVLPRFCLENYLIDPTELWPAVPPAKQAKIPGGQPAFSTEIARNLDQYVRHGALWKVATPLWTGLRALGFKEALASETSMEAAQDDEKIRETLRSWHAFLDPDPIFAELQAQIATAQAAPRREQYASWIHGKLFWTQAVVPVMNRLFGQESARARRDQVLRALPKPADLQPILQHFST